MDLKATQSHKLFQQFPLDGEVQTSVGRLPTPYQVYAGHGMLIAGLADLALIAHLLEREKLYPLKTKDGYAMLAVWVCNFTQASLGPHNELQCAIPVTHQPPTPIETHPLSLLKALFLDPEARLFCHGLWTNTAAAVAYNREILGLNAHLNQADLVRRGGRKVFIFHDEEDRLIVRGRVREARRTPLSVTFSLFGLFGVRRALRALARPYFETKVVNPIGPRLTYNANAPTYLAPDTPVIQWFDRARDSLEFELEPYRSLDFKPLFVQHFAPFRFVYLRPAGLRK